MADRPVLLEEIEITPEMVKAGLVELYAFRFGSDPNLLVEAIYRAMAYEDQSASASDISVSR